MCDGRVLAWGANGNNQCGVSGNPVTTPQFVQRDTNGDGTPDGDLTNIVMVCCWFRGIVLRWNPMVKFGRGVRMTRAVPA